MKEKRRTLRVILAIALMLALVPVTGFARSDAPGQGTETWQSTDADSAKTAADVTNAVPAVTRQTTDAPRQEWSLLNLLLALLTVIAAVALSLGLFGVGGTRMQSALRSFTLVPAAAAAALFLLTQNMGRAMVLFDARTGWMLGIALVQTGVCVLSGVGASRHHKHADA